MKTLKLLSIIAAAGVLASPVLACGDGPWMGVNLVATPNVKSALRSAYAVNRNIGPAQVGAPLSGHTYYGSYSGTRYAVATFGAYPTIFRTDFRGRWHVIRQTHGGVCTSVVPLELIKVWWLEHRRGGCYVEPGSETSS